MDYWWSENRKYSYANTRLLSNMESKAHNSNNDVKIKQKKLKLCCFVVQDWTKVENVAAVKKIQINCKMESAIW